MLVLSLSSPSLTAKTPFLALAFRLSLGALGVLRCTCITIFFLLFFTLALPRTHYYTGLGNFSLALPHQKRRSRLDMDMGS